MIGLGTIVNCGAIIAGTTLGVFLKGGLPRRFETTIMQALGLCTFFIGIGGAVAGLVTIEDGALSTQHTMLLVLSLVIGALIGEALDIETRLNDFGTWCQMRFAGGGEDGKFVEGFVASSLLFCVGAMAIVGALDSGLRGDHSTLIAKSALDGVSAVIFASAMGPGVLLSAAAVLVYQGAIALLAQYVAPFLTDAVVTEMSAVGGLLIVGIAINMFGLLKVRVGNLLPAVFMPIAVVPLMQLIEGLL